MCVFSGTGVEGLTVISRAPGKRATNQLLSRIVAEASILGLDMSELVMCIRCYDGIPAVEAH